MIEKKRILLFCAAGVSLLLGILIGFLPLLVKKDALNQQDKLVRSIEQSDGTLIVASIPNAEISYYDDADSLEYDYWDATEHVEVSDDGTESILEGIGIIEIERIGLRLPVVEGVRKADLKVALGHAPSTSRIGEMGNALIAGHRSYTYGEFFNRLDEVRVGDAIRFTDRQGSLFSFSVYETLVVKPNDPSVFDVTDYPSITLLTCTPVRKATHRLIVRARLQ